MAPVPRQDEGRLPPGPHASQQLFLSQVVAVTLPILLSWFSVASLMLHSALLFGHPPNLAGFADRFVLVLERIF